MKRLIFFLVLIFSFSACTDFRHMHYRHVKKVPAKGFVEPRIENKSLIVEEEFSSTRNSPNKIQKEISDQKIFSKESVEKNDSNYNYSQPSSFKKKIQNLSLIKKVTERKIVKFKKPVFHQKRKGGTAALVILFLFLTVFLMIIGGAILVGVVYTFNFWLLLLGLVIFLLGLLPFIGLIVFAFGGGYKNDLPAYDEK